MKHDYEYDIALSFAGEDRDYVDKVAEYLKEQKVKVFYDRFEEINLWGKNLYTHLSSVYKDKANYTVMFISKHYAEKLWTNHERESAQARAFKENNEYILPARFDDTQIPGILDTVGYINLGKHKPNEFGLLICKKINSNFSPSSVHINSKSSATISSTSVINNNVVKSELKLRHIQQLIDYANSCSGLGMSIHNARSWTMSNFPTISNLHTIEEYIDDMNVFISFANSTTGLGMSIHNARSWAIENFNEIKSKYGIKNYVSKMEELIIFANSGSGFGMSIHNARSWSIDNFEEYKNRI